MADDCHIGRLENGCQPGEFDSAEARYTGAIQLQTSLPCLRASPALYALFQEMLMDMENMADFPE